MIDPWLPRNYHISDNIVLKQICFSGQSWQIFQAEMESSVLIARESIAQFWISSGLLDSAILQSFDFGNERFYFLQSPSDMFLTPVSFDQEFITYEDGKSFALALSESRKIVPEKSFVGGVFVERYSRILPDEEDTMQTVSDDILLGRWLSRGTEISACSIQRMLQLFPTVTQNGLEDILKTAHMVPHAVTEKKRIETDKPKQEKIPKEKELFSLPGRETLETFFRDYIIDIVQNPDEYKNMGIDFPTAFILQGPPGCGKTYAVEKLVEYLEWPCFFIDSGSIGSPYIHETSKKIAGIFEEAIQQAPSVLVIDEMESFLSDRNGGGAGNGHHVEEVAEFLRKIPEATQKHVLVVAMTNMISSIDAAIRRKGRFDHIIEVGMPSKQEILAVLKNGLDKVPHDDDLDLEKICAILADHPISDVSFVMREAARITAKSHMKSISASILDAAVSGIAKNKKTEHRPIGFAVPDGDEK